MKTANPSQVVLAGVRQSKTTCLSFHRNANGLGELKRQSTLGREGGYVLLFLCIRFALRLRTVFGIVFALVFRGLCHRVGFQLVGFSAQFHRSERYLQFLVLDLDDAPDHFCPFGNHGLSSTWTGVESLAANVSPTWFLLLARVWPTVALISVPFGRVTIVVGCGALLETVAAFGVSAFSGVAAASLVAWFEQPATVKNPAAAAASQSLRWN